MNTLKMNLNEFLTWASDHVLRGIGKGIQLRALIHDVVDHALCNEVFSEKGIYIRLEKVIKGCNLCDYDEAEGGLWDHCDDCRSAVTREVVKIVSGQ